MCRSFMILAAVAGLIVIGGARVFADTIIDPTSVSSPSSAVYPIEAVKDGSGIGAIPATGPVTDWPAQTVTQDGSLYGSIVPGNMWLASGTSATITFDLGAKYNLTSTHVWNYDECYSWIPGLPATGLDLSNRSAKDVTIYVASSVGGDWTEVGTGGVQFAQAAGLNYEPLTDKGQDYSLVASNVCEVRFVIADNWGDTGYVGLSEVRFEGTPTPEPSCLVLLVTGLLGLLAYAWRKRK